MSLGRFFRRARWDDERRRELQSYVDTEIDEQVARGVPLDEATRLAYRKLGNPTLVREEIYRMNTLGWLDAFWRDLRYGARLLRLNPGFAAVALLSLALGIGANTAIFQLIDTVSLRTLPVPNPDELVEIRVVSKTGRTGQFTGRYPRLTRPLWEQIRARTQEFSQTLAWGGTRFDLSTTGESRYVEGLWVSAEFFDALAVKPVLGRLAGPSDDVRVCADTPVVVSAAFWQREFGGATDVVGRTVRLDGTPFAVGGVAPAGFFGVDVGRGFDVAVPICAADVIRPPRPTLDDRQVWWLAAFGRLAPGWTPERATKALEAAAPAIFESTVAADYTVEDTRNYKAFTLQATPTPTGVSTLRRDYGTPLVLLLAIAGLVLFIACANLANLMLARATAREREIAVRLAIGASRSRIVRQLLAESLLIAAAGAVLGVAVAQILSRLLVAFLTTTSSAWMLDLAIDWRLLGFAAALAALTCLLFGVGPAIRATRTSPGAVMKAGGRGLTASTGRFGFRRSLVVVQMAISLVLLVGALLFVRTLTNLSSLDPGFRQRGVLVAELDLRALQVPLDQQALLQRRIVDRIAALPAVRGAASVSIVPSGQGGWNERVIVDGVAQSTYPNANRVSPGFFGAMAIPVLAGRNFDAGDTATSPPVVIVNASFAARFLPGASPVGRSFKLDVGPQQASPSYEIVGVVADTKYNDLREPIGPIMFFPDTQETHPSPYLTALVVTDGPVMDLRAPITRAADDEGSGILLNFSTLEQQTRDSLLRERLMAALSGGFAALAVLLAAVGLYGVMSYTVARRRNEIGIRMALGATRGDVMRMILNETALLVGIGAVLGIGLALYAARATATLLFGLTPGDPWTIAIAALLLAAVAAAAATLPTRRAVTLEPTRALREE